MIITEKMPPTLCPRLEREHDEVADGHMCMCIYIYIYI